MNASFRARCLFLAIVIAMAVAQADAGITGVTIEVVPASADVDCAGSFEILVRNASASSGALEISSITLHHAYSQGDYGFGFTWDTSGFAAPLSLDPGESVTIPVSYSAAGERFNSRLVLEVVSNADNDGETRYLAYRGTLCATPTPTRPSTPTATPTSTPTPTSEGFCPPHIDVSPPSGPAGTVVELQGRCYALHSGRSARLFLDDADIGYVAGETGGDYQTLIRIPAEVPTGPHVIRISSFGMEYGLGSFEVTGSSRPCTGDCDGDEDVELGEVVTGIGIALGRVAPQACPGFGSSGFLITELVAAVESLLDGCGTPPPLDSFAGSYEVVGGAVDFIGSPGGVNPLQGMAAVSQGELMLEIDYLNGVFDVAGRPSADGSLSLDGIFRRGDGSSTPAGGSAVALVNGTTHWITGELRFDEQGTGALETLRFSMQR